LESNKSTSKLKVTFFSALPPFRGGISNFSELLLEQLEKITCVQSFTFKNQYPNFLFPGKTQYNKRNIRVFQRIVSTFNPMTYFSARKIFKDSLPDIFITNYWMTFFGPMMAFFAKGFNKDVKKVAIIHNLSPHEKRFFDTFFNRIFLSNYDGFVVLSEAVKKEVLAIRNDATCIVLKHPPYNQFGLKSNRDDCIKLLGLSPSKNTILFFGLIRDYKGLDLLIEAFSFLDDSYQLIIAGEVYGSDHKYQELISASRNKNILFQNDFIPDDQVSFYFGAADLCVLPYKSATQSGIKAIADSFEIPVLTTNVGGLAESISPNENGFIIEIQKPIYMAKQIKSIFETESLKKVSFNLSKNKSSEINQWHEFALNLLNFCQELKSES
jgi:glycosyltransferase involved in cell wall biosynthesis